MRKTFPIFCVLVCTIRLCVAQSIPVKLPAIVPPPAEAASLGRYGDVPVDMSSGSINISVPVYEIKTPRFTIPISLNYNSSGVKVDDIASWVGLGWTLNAGGLITRSVRGLDDFLSGNSKGYYYHSVPEASSLSQMEDWQFLDDVSNGLIDEEPDYFFFNFLNHRGKYAFDQNKKPMIIQYQDPLKVQYNATTGTFSILDGEGNQYIFFDKESTQSYYTTLSTDPFPNHQQQYISSWYLSQIISFDKSDTIRFFYYTDYEQVQTSYNYSEAVGPTYECSSPRLGIIPGPERKNDSHDGFGEISSQTFIKSTPLRLQEITFRNGKVVFSSSRTRQDATVAKLDYITVYGFDAISNSYVSLKKINLNYDYYTTTYNNKTSYRLKLESVATQGSANEEGGKYTFDYDQTMLPPINSNAKDLFGYYNGHLENTTLIPTQLVSYNGFSYTVGGANRNTDPDFIQAGVLKKIFYPTGGRSEFEYEPNSYAEQGVQTINSGAAATGIMNEIATTNFTATVTAQAQLTVHISRFDYPSVQTRPMVSLTNLTTGKVIYSNSLTNASTDFNHSDLILIEAGQSYQLIAKAFDDDHVSSSINLSWQQPDPNLASKYGGGLRIKQVNSYKSDGVFSTGELYKYGNLECGYGYLPCKNYLFNTLSAERYFELGCTDPQTLSCSSMRWMRMTFNASSIYDVFNLSGPPVSYTEVTKYPVDEAGNVLGKTVYGFSLYQNSTLPGTQTYYEGDLVVNSGWTGGLLLSQTDYSYVNNSYNPVRKVVNNYTNVGLGEIQGLKVGYTANISGCFILGPTGTTYYYVSYPVYAGTSLRTSTTTYDYSNSDPTMYVMKTEQTTYDNLEHLQPTKIVSNSSNGSLITVENQYPVDAALINGITADQRTAINNLYNQHNITAPIQIQTARNSAPISLIRNDYKTWVGDLTLPEAMFAQSASNPLEKRLSFNNYDSKGNILEQQKANDVIHSYIWGYNRTYPIAEVTNASSDKVAYTSFEDADLGGWTLNGGSTILDGTVITGKKTCTGGVHITVPEGDYTVSLWAAANCAVNGQAGTPLRVNQADGWWRYFEWKLTNVSYIEVWGDNIDEVRLYPSNAQMTTYTYEPLIGMTSRSDANSRPTYYEYDGLGRLRFVRDQDKNILKKICYNYKGQPEECMVNTTPQWSATGNYRCVLDASSENTGYQEREETDTNPNSTSYNQTRWVDNGYNTTACPLPSTCDYSTCGAYGEEYACIDGQCEFGFKVYTSSYYDFYTEQYECTYHYEYSDGSWSPDYMEYSPFECYN